MSDRVRPVAARVLAAALPIALAGCGLLAPPPAWERRPPPPREAPVVEPGALHRFELDNGIRGMVLEDHRLPSLMLGVTTRRGAGAEPAAQAGLAIFTAELMQRGAGERDALALAAVVDAIGADLGVGASWDAMSVSVSGLSRDRDTLFEVLGDVVLRPRLEAAEAEKTRAQMLARLEQANDQPEQLIGWHAARTVFGEHRYGLPQGGLPDTVAGLTAEDARAFHAGNFVAANLIVFGAGDIEAAEFEERVRTLFASTPAGEPPSPVARAPDPAPPARRIVVADKPELGQSRIIVAHDGIARTDERRIGAALLNDVLGGSGFSSRLMQRVRAEAGLTYGVWSGFQMRREPGAFYVETFTRVPETRRTVDLLLDALTRIRSEPPDAEELANAKSYAVGRFGLSLETSERVLMSLVDLEVHDLPRDSLDTYRARVRAVDEQDVASLASELIHPERAAIVVLGPAAELVPQLEGLGEIEVVEP